VREEAKEKLGDATTSRRSSKEIHETDDIYCTMAACHTTETDTALVTPTQVLPDMKTVQAIIDLFGGLENLRNNPIKIEVAGFMPLSIEYIGTGPRGLPLVSVMHFYEQHGDICRDPDVEFEVDSNGKWHPVSYRQDSIGTMQEAILRDSGTGKLLVRPKLLRDLKRFAKLWSKNLNEQGFLEKAREMARAGKPPE
jgi:hypothetical protein